MPLQHLTRIIVDNFDDGLQTSRLPNNEEMMNKINEIINFVNMLENKKQNKPIEGFGFKSRNSF